MMQFIISMIQFALKNENMYNVIQYFPIDAIDFFARRINILTK